MPNILPKLHPPTISHHKASFTFKIIPLPPYCLSQPYSISIPYIIRIPTPISFPNFPTITHFHRSSLSKANLQFHLPRNAFLRIIKNRNAQTTFLFVYAHDQPVHPTRFFLTNSFVQEISSHFL